MSILSFSSAVGESHLNAVAVVGALIGFEVEGQSPPLIDGRGRDGQIELSLSSSIAGSRQTIFGSWRVSCEHGGY